MVKHWYGFAYEDGHSTTRNTTSGRIYTAGNLFAFLSRDDRDKWVDAGYSCRVPSDVGEYRVAVKRRDLPFGWTERDAVDAAETVDELAKWPGA